MENPAWNRPLFNEANAKTVKGEKLGYLTLILYLAPAASALVPVKGKAQTYVNVCPYSTPGCVASCLNTAGRGVYDNVQEARRNKTHAFFEDRNRFYAKAEAEIRSALKRAGLLGLKLAVRMNGTSDIPALDLTLASRFPEVQFYGYTKVPPMKDPRRKVGNIHLTYSYAETAANQAEAFNVLDSGGNVAVVFSTRSTGDLPTEWMGYPVINGDEHDVRFLDPVGTSTGYVVGLRAKGRARHDTSGFVVQVGGGRL